MLGSAGVDSATGCGPETGNSEHRVFVIGDSDEGGIADGQETFPTLSHSLSKNPRPLNCGGEVYIQGPNFPHIDLVSYPCISLLVIIRKLNAQLEVVNGDTGQKIRELRISLRVNVKRGARPKR